MFCIVMQVEIAKVNTKQYIIKKYTIKINNV